MTATPNATIFNIVLFISLLLPSSYHHDLKNLSTQSLFIIMSQSLRLPNNRLTNSLYNTILLPQFLLFYLPGLPAKIQTPPSQGTAPRSSQRSFPYKKASGHTPIEIYPAKVHIHANPYASQS